MELVYKYTTEDIENSTTIVLVNSTESLTKENFDNYTLGYEGFSSVTRVSCSPIGSDGVRKYEFSPADNIVGYNYILFLSNSDEVIGFSRLQSPLNFNKYKITTITLYISFNFNEKYVEDISIECSYDIHIARIAEVHKQLFNANYQNRTANIEELNDIEQLDSTVVANLYNFKTNNNRLIRYSGHYYFSETNGQSLTRIKRLVGLSFSIGTFAIKSLFRKDSSIYAIAINERHIDLGLFLLKFNSSGNSESAKRLEIDYNSNVVVYGSIIDTGNTVFDVKNNVSIQYNNKITKIIYDEANSTIYTVGIDSKFICGRLYNLITRHGFSQAITRVRSISNSYILYQNGGSYTLSSHNVSIIIGRNFKQLIPITSKLYLVILTTGEYIVYEVKFDEEQGEYVINTINLGREFEYNGQTKCYFKHIEIFAKNRYTNLFTNIQPFSFEGTLFTKDRTILRTL